jgi:glycosyltransferase involved in cell wall biosynthesis
LRITFVVPVLEVSGGARIIAGHAERLAKKGHEVVIVAPQPERASFKDKARAILGIGSRPLRPDQSLVALADVRLHIPQRERSPIQESDVPDADVIVATWWETAEWIWPMAATKGAKVHFIQHYESFQNLPTERVDAVWRLPTAKIAVAQWLVDLGRERFGIENMALVPNSVEQQFFDAPARAKGRPPTIGFLFHNADFKDVPTTIAAIERLKQLRPDVRLVSFGSMEPNPGEMPPDVEFHYLPTQEQIAGIYARCDAWLSTSRSEGFNLPPLEAMASGCPAVCAKTGRPLEIIQNGVNGHLVDQGDIEGFAEALASIASLSEQRWRDMSDAARCAVAHPTWDESSAMFEKALKQAA